MIKENDGGARGRNWEGLLERECGWGRGTVKGDECNDWEKGTGGRRGAEKSQRAEPITLTSVAHPAKLLAPLKALGVVRAGMPCADYMEAIPDGNAGGCRVHAARLVPAWPVCTLSESFKPEDGDPRPWPSSPFRRECGLLVIYTVKGGDPRPGGPRWCPRKVTVVSAVLVGLLSWPALVSGRQEARDRREPARQFLTSHPPMGRNPRCDFHSATQRVHGLSARTC